MSIRLVWLLLIFVLFSPLVEASPLTDQQEILRGVSSLEIGGSVGTLLVYGENAVTFAEGEKNEISYPVAAAARLGEGRLAAFGHESAFGGKFDANEKALTNLLTWLSGQDSSLTDLKIAVHSNRDFAKALRQRNIAFTDLNSNSWKKTLSESDVIVASVGAMTQAEADDLASFVKAGGGVGLVNLHCKRKRSRPQR